jgi:hypothetical protein
MRRQDASGTKKVGASRACDLWRRVGWECRPQRLKPELICVIYTARLKPCPDDSFRDFGKCQANRVRETANVSAPRKAKARAARIKSGATQGERDGAQVKNLRYWADRDKIPALRNVNASRIY